MIKNILFGLLLSSSIFLGMEKNKVSKNPSQDVLDISGYFKKLIIDEQKIIVYFDLLPSDIRCYFINFWEIQQLAQQDKDAEQIANFMHEKNNQAIEKALKSVNPNVRFGKNTLLHLTAMRKNYEVAKILIAHGADLNVQAYLKRTPLHEAAFWDSDEIIQLLLDNGADVTILDCDGLTASAYRDNKNLKTATELALQKKKPI
jgi:hypothetical protein